MSHKLTPEGISTAALELGVESAVVKAVAEVESSGSGFLDDGRPKILFEGHKFSKFTGGIYDLSHPTISYPKWTKRHYIGREGEYERLAIAQSLNFRAALRSASWGAFQIMGFNFKAAGFESVEHFVTAMHESSDRHLLAFVSLIKSWGLQPALQAKDWKEVARVYNGSGQVDHYAALMAAAYRKHAAA